MPGSRENQAVFVCKNEGCGWSGNADHNRPERPAPVPDGPRAHPGCRRAVVRRPRGVKPATAR
ncbi:hypothetical protein [Streptomyces sp. F001]|uniref:hypothetical protein n=1 Tax=Streptomyces sp. F001 TaxID=1510026 RepID=UPI003208E427